MTKAMLSRRGVEFDALDVENDATAFAELQRLGVSSVPTVVVGERWMTGWNPSRLADLVGLVLQEAAPEADQLLSSLRQILDATIRAARQVPESGWETTAPGRSRPLRELVRHVFHVVEAGVDADIQGIFPAGRWLVDMDLPMLTGAERLARYGEAVRAKFDAWYVSGPSGPPNFERTIDADVGPRSLTQVLQRTRLHAAQHLRQVYAFLGWLKVAPLDPLDDATLQNMGLDDLPDEIF